MSPKAETAKLDEKEKKEALRVEIKSKVKEKIDLLMYQEVEKVRRIRPDQPDSPMKGFQIAQFDDLSSVNHNGESIHGDDEDQFDMGS